MAAGTTEHHFKEGSEVEISSEDEGFQGSWFIGTVIQSVSSGSTDNLILVEYKTLTADEAGKIPLREKINVVNLRPLLPLERRLSFKLSQEVDAAYNDGWWEGVVTKVHANEDKYSVFFRGSREQLEFSSSQLRLHREWVNGKWVPPLHGEENVATVEEVKLDTELVKDKFSTGMLVEVSNDEDGFQGAWFAATIIEQLGEDKFLIEYKSLRNDDDTEFLREETDTRLMRPYPPGTTMVDCFSLYEEVDALYNDGWWLGVIIKVLKSQRYVVYFKDTNEELEFEHSDLRLHHERVNGKWVQSSQALKL